MKEKNNTSQVSLFIIGPQKSGTTTIYELLKKDIRFILPKNKETHFFSSNYSYGYNWYHKQFAKRFNKEILCEVDPSYMYCNEAIKRIHQYNNNSKFIVILRQPLERAYSQYLMSKYRGYEEFSFNPSDKEPNELAPVLAQDIVPEPFVDNT